MRFSEKFSKFSFTSLKQTTSCLCIIITASIAQTRLTALDTVILDKNSSEVPLGLHLEILEDREKRMSFKDVQKTENEHMWKQNKSPVPNFGFSDSAYWLRFEISNPTLKKDDRILEIAFPPIDYLDFYSIKEDGNYSVTKTGDRRPFSAREYKNRNFLFKISIDPDTTERFWIRTWSHNGLHDSIPIILYDNEKYLEKSTQMDTFLGVYLGILFVMIFYNLFIFFSVKDISYLYYILYLSNFFMWIFVYYGYAYQYLWPDSPEWGNYSIILFTDLFITMIIQFSRKFLSTHLILPRLDRFLKFCTILFIIYIPMIFILKYSTVWILIFFSAIPSAALLVLAGFLCFRNGYRPALYYLISWTFLFFGGSLLMLKISSAVPSNLLTENSAMIGAIMEVILLSLGLGDKINDLKRQNELVVLKNQEDLEKMNKELEAKVFQRTVKLEKANAELESLAESRKRLSAVGEIVSAIVHDIKNPIGTVKAYAEMLKDSTSEQERQDYTDMILKEADRLGDMAYEILDFSRGKMSLNTSTYNIIDFINEIYNFLKIDFEYTNISFKIRCSCEGSIPIDRDRLRRVFINIANNAREAILQSGKGTQFSIHASEDNESVVFRLKDDGPGIPESMREKMFQAFRTEGKAKGTGLGLYMSKMIIDSHGGKISFITNHETGTEFIIRIPKTA